MKHFIRTQKGIDYKVLGSKTDKITCRQCLIKSPQANFHIASATAQGFRRLQHTCKICANRLRMIRHALVKDSNTPLKPDNCSHCGKQDSKIVLDHDWTTGKFRNWSCINCNSKFMAKTFEEYVEEGRRWYHR